MCTEDTIWRGVFVEMTPSAAGLEEKPALSLRHILAGRRAWLLLY